MQLPPELVPRPYSTSAAWWDAAAEGLLMVQRCARCAAVQLYPREHCTSCWARELDLVRASGSGTVHSWTVTHRHPEAAFDPPFVYAIVELDEGPRLTSIIDAAAELVRVGTAVTVTFTAVDEGRKLPIFTVDSRQPTG